MPSNFTLFRVSPYNDVAIWGAQQFLQLRIWCWEEFCYCKRPNMQMAERTTIHMIERVLPNDLTFSCWKFAYTSFMQIETFDMIWDFMGRELKGTFVQKMFLTKISDACPWILRYPQYEFYSPLLVAMSQGTMNGCHPQLWNRWGLTSSTGSSPQTRYIRSQRFISWSQSRSSNRYRMVSF